MIEFKIVQAEYVMEWDEYHDGMPIAKEVRSIEKVLADMVNEGWNIHTIDLSLDYPKALMEREL